jgi:hypothetical protein
MNPITGLTPQQLRKAADIKEKIVSLQKDLDQILGAPPEILTEAPRRKKRRLSAQGLANIRAGVRKRLGRLSNVEPAVPGRKRKRRMSAEQKERLSAIAKARWRKARTQGKNAL